MWPGPEDDYAISDTAKDLITSLLAFETSDRLGSGGVEDVKNHPWFEGIEWETLREQPAVMVPQVSSAYDTSYFDARQDMFEVDSSDITEDLQAESLLDDALEEEDHRYRGFSFINLNHLASANTDYS